MAAEVFGNANKFSDYGLDSVMIKTMRLPRKENDITKLVASTANSTKESRSQQSILSESRLHQSEASKHVNRSVSNSSRLVNHSKNSKFTLASIQSLNSIQPRILNLQKDLRDHRVLSCDAARPARTRGCPQRRVAGPSEETHRTQNTRQT